MPFPFPLVPGSHADTSVINNASNPSNMPLAGSHSIPQVLGPALCCSCSGRSWPGTEKSGFSLEGSATPGRNHCDRQAAPTPARSEGPWGVCEGECVGGKEWEGEGRSRNTMATECSNYGLKVVLTWWRNFRAAYKGLT